MADPSAIWDVKCVSQTQPNYSLQLGGYLSLSRNGGFGVVNVGIIHVTKNGVRLVDYPAGKCADQWERALAWYQTLNELQ